MVNEYGIFVIETKHYAGWIFGKEKDYKWTQSFNNGQKFTFLNPLIQNEFHTNQLKKYFPSLDSKDFKSIIVFTGEAELKSMPINNVIKAIYLPDHIKQFKEKRLSEIAIERIIGRLEFKREEQSEETDQAHIKYVQNIKNRKLNSKKI